MEARNILEDEMADSHVVKTIREDKENLIVSKVVFCLLNIRPSKFKLVSQSPRGGIFFHITQNEKYVSSNVADPYPESRFQLYRSGSGYV